MNVLREKDLSASRRDKLCEEPSSNVQDAVVNVRRLFRGLRTGHGVEVAVLAAETASMPRSAVIDCKTLKQKNVADGRVLTPKPDIKRLTRANGNEFTKWRRES